MIHIRANRQTHGFVELHIPTEGKSVNFPGSAYVTVTNLDALITTLQEVQSFMAHQPENDYRKWEVS